MYRTVYTQLFMGATLKIPVNPPTGVERMDANPPPPPYFNSHTHIIVLEGGDFTSLST